MPLKWNSLFFSFFTFARPASHFLSDWRVCGCDEWFSLDAIQLCPFTSDNWFRHSKDGRQRCVHCDGGKNRSQNAAKDKDNAPPDRYSILISLKTAIMRSGEWWSILGWGSARHCWSCWPYERHQQEKVILQRSKCIKDMYNCDDNREKLICW